MALPQLAMIEQPIGTSSYQAMLSGIELNIKLQGLESLYIFHAIAIFVHECLSLKGERGG